MGMDESNVERKRMRLIHSFFSFSPLGLLGRLQAYASSSCALPFSFPPLSLYINGGKKGEKTSRPNGNISSPSSSNHPAGIHPVQAGLAVGLSPSQPAVQPRLSDKFRTFVVCSARDRHRELENSSTFFFIFRLFFNSDDFQPEFVD